MENLVSQISSQRPACEMDYHQHYRTIENQHRLLLDAAEKVNSSSGDAGSWDDSTHVRGSQARAVTPPKMVRAYSFDRGIQARRREGSAERKAKPGVPGELKTLKKLHHRTPSPSPSSSSFSSPQPVRSSKIISKAGRATQDINGRQNISGRQLVGVGRTALTESTSKCELAGSYTVLRAKSELDRVSPDTQPFGTCPASHPGSLWSNNKQDALDAASFSGEMNLNSTFSSSCDFYPEGHEEAESPHQASRQDLKLEIRPGSQSTIAGGDHDTNHPNVNGWDSRFNNLDFPQNGGAYIKHSGVYLDTAEGAPQTLPLVDQTKAVVHKKVIDTDKDRIIDNPSNLDEAEDAHRTQAVMTSTHVQSVREDDIAANINVTSPKPLKVSINP